MIPWTVLEQMKNIMEKKVALSKIELKKNIYKVKAAVFAGLLSYKEDLV